MPATLSDRAAALRAEAQTIIDTAAADGRAPTDDEQARFDELVAGAQSLRTAAAAQSQAQAVLNAIATEPDHGAAQAMIEALGAGRTRQSFGQAFVDSPIMADIRHRYPSGVPSGETIPQTGSTRVGDLRNALLTDPHSATPLHVMDVPAGVAVLNLLDVITIIDGAPDTIKHFTASFTNAAAVVADGAVKPESALTWTPVSLVQETIAHTLPVNNQALNHNPLMRQFIDRFMISGVRARVQTKVATDLAAWTGLGTQAFDTNLRVTLRKAVTKAQNAGIIAGSGPVAIGISSTDAETLDLEQLANLVLSPGEAPQQASAIWRTPLIVSLPHL